jgi:F-box-like
MRHRKVVFHQRGPGTSHGHAPVLSLKQRTDLGMVGLIFFPRVTIESLPHDVLLDIFDFSLWWYTLVHVCRRWRYIVFQSPLRLNLRLLCRANTPVKKTLDVWPPALPIIIDESRPRLPLSGANIIAALEHHDRVSEIFLDTTSNVSKRLCKVMKKPYPVLTSLHLRISKSAPVFRDTFLGGSAPRLKYLHLTGILFPALPKLLPSCHDLVEVQLWNIPNTGYISPEAMATALSALAKLEVFHIGFRSPASRPDPGNSLPSSLTRAVLPALTDLEFHGASEYFEGFVARIDTPSIISLHTAFFNQLDFDIPHFAQFIGRTQIPGSVQEAMVYFADHRYVHFDGRHRGPPGGDLKVVLSIEILCHGLDWQLGCLAQICGNISPFLSNVERLFIAADPTKFKSATNLVFPDWKDYVDNPQWLEIFHAFPAVQHMHIRPRLGETIASALQELSGERVMDALPVLHHLYLPYDSYFTEQTIQPFISSRQRSNHPVTVHITEMD